MSRFKHMKFEVTCDSNGTNCWVPVEQAKQLLCDAMELEAEVERLRASSFVTAVPSAQYERVIKAGDMMLGTMLWAAAKNPDGPAEKRIAAWIAAKGEGTE